MDPRAAAVRARLQGLFDHCRAGDAAAAAEFILVNQPHDPMRHLRAASDYADAQDRQHVDALVRRIGGWLKCDRVIWGEFLTSSEAEGEWLAWEVSFMTGPDGPRRYFGFLDVNGAYCLGDIDQ